MKNEFNDIKIENGFDSKVNEFPNYSEFNNSSFQSSSDIKEVPIYDEKNEKETNSDAIEENNNINKNANNFMKKIITSPAVVSKAVASFVIVTAAAVVIVDSGIVFSSKTKVEEMHIERSDTGLYINVLFSELNSEEELELVVRNDFTSRTYSIDDVYGHGLEEESIYYYSQEVDNLKDNATYTVEIISGMNTLYSTKYTIDAEYQIPLTTNVLDLYTSYLKNVIYYDIKFDTFVESDIVRLEIEKDGIIYDSININSQVDMTYSGSYEIEEIGIYNLNLYVNNNLILTKDVIVETLYEKTTINTVELSKTDDNIINYLVRFDKFSSEDEVKLNIVKDDIVLYEEIINSDSVYDSIYSGSYEAIDYGTYIVKVIINGDLINSTDIELEETVTRETIVDSFNALEVDNQIAVTITLSDVLETDYMFIDVLSHGETLQTKDVELSSMLSYEVKIDVTEAKEYELILYVNNRDVEIAKKTILFGTVNTAFDGDLRYEYNSNILYVYGDLAQYDTNETIMVEVYDSENVLVDKKQAEPMAVGDGTTGPTYEFELEFENITSGTYNVITKANDHPINNAELELEPFYVTSVEDISYEQQSLIQTEGETSDISVYISFYDFSSDEEIRVRATNISKSEVIYDDNITAVNEQNEYTFDISGVGVGNYEVVVYLREDILSSKVIEVTSSITAVESLNLSSGDGIISFTINFTSYSENENIKAILYDQSGEYVMESAVEAPTLEVSGANSSSGSFDLNSLGSYIGIYTVKIMRGDEVLSQETVEVTE